MRCDVVTFELIVCSAVDLLDLDRIRREQPLVLAAKYSDVVLGPGDMLFIPRWWWHYVTAVAPVQAQQWNDQHCSAPCSYDSTEDEDQRSSRGDIRRSSPEVAIYGVSSLDRAENVSEEDCFSWSINFWWGERRIKPSP